MNQHIKALQGVKEQLAQSGHTNQTAVTAQYGEYADLVGMAFDRYAQLDTLADSANYENQLANANAESAYDDYETILETVKMVLETQPETA